jgi:transcription initiation factor TFIIB
VPRLASELGVGAEMRPIAERLASVAKDHGLANGHNPAGVAAECLYEAAGRTGKTVTERKLGEAADVSRMTVRERWREARQMTGLGPDR